MINPIVLDILLMVGALVLFGLAATWVLKKIGDHLTRKRNGK